MSCIGLSCSIIIQTRQPLVASGWDGVLNLADVELWYAGSKIPYSTFQVTASLNTDYYTPSHLAPLCIDGNSILHLKLFLN